MEHYKQKMSSTYNYVKTFIKWAICAVIVGVVGGIIGSIFYKCVAKVTEYRMDHFGVLFLLPLGGVIIIAMYRLAGMPEDRGTNIIIGSIRSAEKIPFKMAPLIFISTVITHLFGGSAGREGAALQMGGSLGSSLGRLIRLDEKDCRILTMCGMSAVFAAVFGTPLTATLFSMEVISVGVVYYTAFLPCVISALIGYQISKGFGIVPTHFVLKSVPDLSVISTIQVILLSALCAVISILFCITMHTVANLFKINIKNQYIRVVVGGILVILFTLALGTTDYNGAGTDIIGKAMGGEARPEAFLIKIILTAITLGAGFKGGEIVPTFFIGATFGNVMGSLLGMNSGFAAAVGMIALFCAVVNCPMASILLSVELFGSEGMLLFGITCAVSYMLSGYYGLYSSQKIMYSKLKPDYINVNTK